MKKVLPLLTALLVCSTVLAQQGERVLNFHSDIAIAVDGEVKVAETIKVQAEGKEIKWGIVREIPLTRDVKGGGTAKTPVKLVSVTCNGKPAKTHTETTNNTFAIRIGDPDALLEPGQYEYVITYTSRNQVRLFDQFDALEWNVTGNNWTLAIDNASAAVTLPGDSLARSVVAYTGAAGSTNKADSTAEKQGNRVRYAATRPLAPGEGLRVVVTFPRDVIKRRVAAPTPTPAPLPGERILNFHSDITIATDGTITVTEKIKVQSEGKEIKRGIIREIPVVREDKKGRRVSVPIKLVSVTCDGQTAKTQTSYAGNNIEIRIGDPNVFLKHGEHEYVITYTSRGHVGFFDNYDELYWNVTGNEWIFPIDRASAGVTLPGDARVLKTYAYTGPRGSKEQAYKVNDQGNSVIFTATRPFAPHEGLTVAVAFPRDIIDRTAIEEQQRQKEQQAAVLAEQKEGRKIALAIFAWTGFAGCVLVFIVISFFGGKRYRRTVIPTFEPPHDWSAAEVRYLNNIHRVDPAEATLTPALIEMAVKGAIIIECKGRKYTLQNTGDLSRLTDDEKQIHADLFPYAGVKTLEVNDTHYLKFEAASDRLKQSLEKTWKIADLFRSNAVLIFLSALPALLPLGVPLINPEDSTVSALLVASPFLMLALFALWRHGFRQKLRIIGWFFLLGAIAFFVGILGDDTLSYQVNAPLAFGYIALALAYVFHARRMPRPTERGTQIKADLDGFRMYMKTAEEHRLNLLNPPERTPELFERLLPYALALGVTNEWCRKFDDVLKRFNYCPHWYNDPERPFVAETFSRSMRSTFASSVTSAARNPSSGSGSSDWSSGSDGGGSSGGGGGGGGGRGW